MAVALAPPVAPMLARLERELPADGYLYEPKWDGFRGLAFRTGSEVDLRSRNQRPLARYFPELVEALLAIPVERFVLDGEIIAVSGADPDFPALLARLHPAASRVERLRAKRPRTTSCSTCSHSRVRTSVRVRSTSAAPRSKTSSRRQRRRCG